MSSLSEEELRRFRRTALVGRETRIMFKEALGRKFTLIESATSDNCPSMVAGIGVSKEVVEEFRKLAEEHGNLRVLSDPQFSKKSILGIWKWRYVTTFIIFEELLMLKRERFDPEKRKVLGWIEPGDWKRVGRRPKYRRKDEVTVGLFGVLFPLSRRETYLIFQLPTVRELFGVSSEMSYAAVCCSIKRMERLMRRRGLDTFSSPGGGGIGGYIKLLLRS